MSTPLGHFLAGVAVGVILSPRRDPRRAAIVGGLVAVAPDLDFIPGLLVGDPSRFHHAATHSFAAAALAAGLASMLAVPRLRWTGLVFAAYCTHLALDYLTVDDSEPRGIPLLWPLLTTTYVAPNPPLDRVLHSNMPLFGAHNIQVAARELLVLLPLVLIVAVWRARSIRRSSHGPPG